MKLAPRDIAAINTMIPGRMVDGLVRYIEDGIIPGGFLQAVITNDLKEACARADDENRYLLWDYVNVLYNHAPSQCWGSSEKMMLWARSRREEYERNKGGSSEAPTQTS